MNRPDRLARSGAITRGVFTGGETVRRERPFGPALAGIIIAVVSVLLLSRGCSTTPANALVVASVPAVTSSPSLTGDSDYELRMPFISFAWPLPRALSTCDTEANPCN